MLPSSQTDKHAQGKKYTSFRCRGVAKVVSSLHKRHNEGQKDGDQPQPTHGLEKLAGVCAEDVAALGGIIGLAVCVGECVQCQRPRDGKT